MSQNKKTRKKNAKKGNFFAFFKNMDPELKSILIKCSGGLVLMMAVFTFVSLLSYLFTWSVDKDLLMNAGRMSKDIDVSNIGGKLGYLWSHFLISDMLGLASFSFVFLLGAVAYRLFFWQRHIGLMRLTFLTVSGAFVLSLALSLFGSVRLFDGGLGGDAGRAITDSLANLVGPVLPWLIVVALAIVWMLFASGRFARWFAMTGEGSQTPEPVVVDPDENDEHEDDDEELDSEDDLEDEQEDDAEVEAPACKVPTGTVPETGQEPRGQDVEPLVPAVTAQGYVDIVAEETSQGDMPTVPEVGDGVTAVRVAEVLVEVEPEATPNAYGHVGIAGEVKVDLQGVCQYAYPGTRGGASVEAVHQELFRHDAHLVGNDNLLAQTVDEAEYSVGHVAHLHLAPVNLLGNGAVAHDRAGNELGEHAYVEQKVHEAPLGRAFLLINIYQIGYTLEDVETDAYGQGYPGVGHGYANHGKGSCRKRGVLENAQRQHVGDDAYVQCQFPVRGLRVYELAYVEVDEHQCEHQEHIHRFAPCIEEQGEEHKAGIAAPVRGEPLPVHVCGKHIGEEECRQEDKEKE